MEKTIKFQKVVEKEAVVTLPCFRKSKSGKVLFYFPDEETCISVTNHTFIKEIKYATVYPKMWLMEDVATEDEFLDAYPKTKQELDYKLSELIQ